MSVQSSSVCTGKIRCADGTCTINFDQEIVSPRDVASGMATGKRMHKPFVITKELDKSSPLLARESPTKQSTGKVSVSDLSIMISVKGRTTKLPLVNNQFTLPQDGIDDDCDLIVSWSWDESNAGGSAKRYEATFNLAVENSEFMASKHTKTGHVTLMK
ncbi:MAG: type VI secretion system tube protein Hcp [Prolixibacteraceae bacterium]